MNFRSLRVSVLVFPLAFGALHAGPTDDKDDKEMAPPVMAPMVADPFYAELDGGVVFLHTPRKNNDNLFTDVGALGGNGKDDSTGNFDTSSIGGSLGGRLGYVLERHPDNPWLGANLRVEGMVNYFESGTGDSGRYAPGGVNNAYWIQSLNGSPGNYIGVFQPSPTVHESTSDYFYQGGASFKSDFNLLDGAIVLTPMIGLDYSHLGQHFDTSATGNVGFFNQQEKIDTDYYGFDFGFDVTAHLTRQLSATYSTSIDPLIASSSYAGHQFVNGGVGVSANSVGDNTSLVTFRATTSVSLCYNLGPVILKLSGGVEYWDYAATVAEAKLPVGSSLFAPVSGSGPSHLVSSSMLNPEVDGAVIVPF